MSDIRDFRISTDKNYTGEMYDGNAPCGKGHQTVDGGVSERWSNKYGGGETYKGNILFASFDLNTKIRIFINYNHLWILDLRYAAKPDFWEYTNIKGRGFPGSPCCSEKSRHSLEPEKIDKILNTKIKNCKFWDMVQARAKELYAQGVIQ